MLAVLLLLPLAGPPGERWHPPWLKEEAGRLTEGFRRQRNAGRLADALRLLERALQRERTLFGDIHDETLGSRVSRVMLLHRLGRFDDALAEQERIVAATDRLHGAGSWQARAARLEAVHSRWLASLDGAERKRAHEAEEALRAAENLQNRERWKEAVPAADAALAKWEALAKPPHPRLALALFTLGSAHYGLSESRKAVAVLARARAMWERVLGKGCPEAAYCVMLTGEAWHDADDLKRAGQSYRAALALLEASHGKGSFATAGVLGSLSNLATDLGERQEARRLMARAADITERCKGPRDRATLARLNQLAMLHLRQGDPREARPLLERAVAASAAAYPSGHPTRALYMNNLGMLLSNADEYSRAVPLLEEALSIRRRALGDDHPWTTSTMNNLALAHQFQGHFPKALRLLLAVREAEEKSLGPGHADYATTLSNLGRLYADMGDLIKAEGHLGNAERIFRKARGPNHADTLRVLRVRANLLVENGDARKAIPLAAEAMRLCERHLGRNDPDSMNSRGLLALARQQAGQAREAIALYLDLLPRSAAARHPDHADHLALQHNLGLAYLDARQPDRALHLLHRVRKRRERLLSPLHWNFTETLAGEARAHFLRGDLENAYRLQEQVMGFVRANIDACGALQSERQQMAARRSLDFHLDLFLALAEKRKGGDQAYERVLPSKGLVVQRQVRQRRARLAADAEESRLLRGIEDADRELARLALAAPGKDDVETEVRIGELTGIKDRLEVALALRGAAPAMPKTRAADVRAALPEGAVLLDFYRYKGEGRRDGDPRVGGFVVRRGAAAEFVPLGASDPIAKAVRTWREAIVAGRGGAAEAAEAARL
ncbi:MAG: tetratricopeptide repeat protein, partial [Gemmataceae bacterium]|nr:tetratricopeptide repeat protein [Gemmataceae bacterium]